jgi:hypothetical protein
VRAIPPRAKFCYLTTLNDLRPPPAQVRHAIVNARNLENHLHIADRRASWEIANGAENPTLQAPKFACRYVHFYVYYEIWTQLLRFGKTTACMSADTVTTVTLKHEMCTCRGNSTFMATSQLVMKIRNCWRFPRGSPSLWANLCSSLQRHFSYRDVDRAMLRKLLVNSMTNFVLLGLSCPFLLSDCYMDYHVLAQISLFI